MDIIALAKSGADTAWQLADSVLKAATVKTGPTITYDPATDGNAVAWANEDACKVLLYGVKQIVEQSTDQQTMGQQNKFTEGTILLRLKDLAVPATTESEIVIGADAWKVHEMQTPPGDAIQIATVRK